MGDEGWQVAPWPFQGGSAVLGAPLGPLFRGGGLAPGYGQCYFQASPHPRPTALIACTTDHRSSSWGCGLSGCSALPCLILPPSLPRSRPQSSPVCEPHPQGTPPPESAHPGAQHRIRGEHAVEADACLWCQERWGQCNSCVDACLGASCHFKGYVFNDTFLGLDQVVLGGH